MEAGRHLPLGVPGSVPRGDALKLTPCVTPPLATPHPVSLLPQTGCFSGDLPIPRPPLLCLSRLLHRGKDSLVTLPPAN